MKSIESDMSECIIKYSKCGEIFYFCFNLAKAYEAEACLAQGSSSQDQDHQVESQ